MGNTESAVVQKRLVRFRPDERRDIEGIFDRLQGTSSSSVPTGKGKVLHVDAFKVGMKHMLSISSSVQRYNTQLLTCFDELV